MNEDSCWRELYRDAMVEIDDSKLQSRIETARSAIARCMKQQSLGSHDGAPGERQATVDALENLRVLQKVEITPSVKRAVEGNPEEGQEAES